jgi:hypothetical protein
MPSLYRVASIILLGRITAGQGITSSGCACKSSCSRTIDTLTSDTWCATSVSPVAGDDLSLRCGLSRYSPSRREWWDYCQLNVTSSTPEESLTTLTSVWTVMTASCTAALAAAYGLAGCTATLLTSPQRTFYWLPCTAALIGACHGFAVGGITSLFIAFIFFSMPYTINVQVGVSLGLAIAIFLTYSALGRHREPPAAPHASVYE